MNRSTDGGQSTAEYALIITFVIIMIISVFVAISPELRDLLQDPVSQESQGEAESSISSAVYD